MPTRFTPIGTLALALGLALAACGGTSPGEDAAVDAAVDAPIDSNVGPSRIDLTGGGRLSGGTLTVDVQLGSPLAHQPTSGGTVVTQPALPIAR